MNYQYLDNYFEMLCSDTFQPKGSKEDREVYNKELGWRLMMAKRPIEERYAEGADEAYDKAEFEFVTNLRKEVYSRT